MLESKSTIKCQKPAPQHWMDHPIGKVGFHLASVISSGKGSANSDGPELRVELVIDGEKRFNAVEGLKSEIALKMGEELHWYSAPGVTMRRVFARKLEDFTIEAKWPEQQAWLKSTLEKFQKVFAPVIMALDHAAFKEQPAN